MAEKQSACSEVHVVSLHWKGRNVEFVLLTTSRLGFPGCHRLKLKGPQMFICKVLLFRDLIFSQENSLVEKHKPSYCFMFSWCSA